MLFKIIAFAFAVETGFMSGGTWNYSARSSKWVDIGALYTSLDANISFGQAYVGGGMSSYFTPTSITTFSPFQMTFIFRAGLDFGQLLFEYEHSCFHPMQPYATIIGNEIKPKYEGGYNKFFVRIETGKGASQ